MSLSSEQKQLATNAFWSGNRVIEDQQNRALKAAGVKEENFLKWRIDFWKNGPTGRGVDSYLREWLDRVTIDE